eukprot:GHVS01070860.1.p1 GENE.GHVS01070860.1~~GHVS01070860.1.p1  ORF type:complete len:348 (+),score=62.78 GHVS01070860.1:36-1079(+)
MGWFGKFNPSVCKANLKMANSRAKLAQNRSQATSQLLRREVAVLLREGKEEKARIKAEQLIVEGNNDGALDILTTMCELLVTRMAFMASERDCPSDLVSTVHSVIYCQTRTGIEELNVVRRQFELKYGKSWVDEAVDNKRQEVHFKLVQLLSVTPPVEREIIRVLSEIAREFKVTSWTPPIDPLEEDAADAFVPQPSTAPPSIYQPMSPPPPLQVNYPAASSGPTTDAAIPTIPPPYNYDGAVVPPYNPSCPSNSVVVHKPPPTMPELPFEPPAPARGRVGTFPSMPRPPLPTTAGNHKGRGKGTDSTDTPPFLSPPPEVDVTTPPGGGPDACEELIQRIQKLRYDS